MYFNDGHYKKKYFMILRMYITFFAPVCIKKTLSFHYDMLLTIHVIIMDFYSGSASSHHQKFNLDKQFSSRKILIII